MLNNSQHWATYKTHRLVLEKLHNLLLSNPSYGTKIYIMIDIYIHWYIRTNPDKFCKTLELFPSVTALDFIIG